MEEEIKILEEYLEQQDRKFVSEYRLKILQAIENLIEAYREKQKTLNEKILSNAGIYQLGFKDGENSYKQKIRDKIARLEEIKKDKYDIAFGVKLESREQQDINKKIEALKELLGEKDVK